MRVLVLHSDVAPDARPDELDTLAAAEAVAVALMGQGHVVVQAPFVPDRDALQALLRDRDVVFNLVESVFGRDELAMLAPAMLEQLGCAYTGSNAAAIALTADKPATKRLLRAAGLATPDWAEGPDWSGLDAGSRYIVKSATADASIGLDDHAVVSGTGVRARARTCAAEFGGRWFAERYVDGREFNVALLGEGGIPRVLPLAEMRFTDWPADRPRIVGYAAKWDESSAAAARTVRRFGCEVDEPALAGHLSEMALRVWHLFGLSGYARVDFRVDDHGVPTILEINPNPCLEPAAGFAVAAEQAGYRYKALVSGIAEVALHA